MFIATLIASGELRAAEIDCAAAAIAGVGGVPGAVRWIDEGIAADLPFGRIVPAAARAALEGLLPGVDMIVQPAAGRRKALLVADMDSTMITVECIDELADYAGIRAEIAAVTERAMRGELDFETALTERVALLAGLDAGVIDRCLAERVRITPGARELVRSLRGWGGRAVLVSGGFTLFADRVAADIGFDRAVSNRLDIAGGVLSGTVERPIVGAAAKRETLIAEAGALGIELDATIALGDGANDIPMIEAAGLGIAFHAKPKTAAAADARIMFGDLTVALHAMGVPRAEWVVD